MLNELTQTYPRLAAWGIFQPQNRYYYQNCGIRLCFNETIRPVSTYWPDRTWLPTGTNISQDQPHPDQLQVTFTVSKGMSITTPWEFQRQLWHELKSLTGVRNRLEGRYWSWFFTDLSQAQSLLTWVDQAHHRWPDLAFVRHCTAVADQQPTQSLLVRQPRLKKYQFKLVLKSFRLNAQRAESFEKLRNSFPDEVEFSPWLQTQLPRFNPKSAQYRGILNHYIRIDSSHIWFVSSTGITYWEMLEPGLSKQLYQVITV